jgi:hypothetical protein
MNPPDPPTPLRLLVKSYRDGILDREQYLEIRHQLLRKLSHQGEITHKDLQNFLEIYQDTGGIETFSSYSASDWVIIVLGILATATLGYILYS